MTRNGERFDIPPPQQFDNTPLTPATTSKPGDSDSDDSNSDDGPDFGEEGGYHEPEGDGLAPNAAVPVNAP